MSRFARSLSRIANVGAILALFYMFGHILFEIVLRNVFARSTFVLDEFIGYAVSALAFLALGETLRRGGLIRVTLMHNVLSPLGVRALETFAALSAAGAGAFGAWYIGRSVLRTYERGTVSASIAAVPQWIPQSLILVGLLVFVLQALAGAWAEVTGQRDAPGHGEAR